jgi:hypothetical protein
VVAFDSVIRLLEGRTSVGNSRNVATERLLLSGVARRGALVVLLVGWIGTAAAGAQTPGTPDCVRYPNTDSVLPNGYPFDAHRAVALFRFHRQQEALQEVDAGRAIIAGAWRWRIPPDQHKELASALDALRNCLATTEPPDLGSLTVRVFGHAPDSASDVGPQAGARVYVEGVALGRTGPDGALMARVPSGPISVEAEIPIDQWGAVDINLAPGQSSAIEITLSDDKEVNEHTTLVLDEAIDDILPVTASSLTLKFVRDGRLAPVTLIDDIEVLDRDGNVRAAIEEQFRVVRGEIVATTAARVFEVLAPQFDDTIVLRVLAMDSEHGLHQGRVVFRVAEWPLSVRLEPPPSNPALSVSNIEIGISLLGKGIAVQRVSDADGRFEIVSFPSGTIAFECVVVSNGWYYSGDAMLDHSGPESVTLVLRSVEDVKNGVAPLRIDRRDDLRLARPVKRSPIR